MASFGTLAPGQQDPEDELLRSQPADGVDWSRFNQPFGQLAPADLSPSERLTSGVQDVLMAGGAQPYVAGHLARGLTGLAGAGPAAPLLSAADFAYYKNRGDLPGAAIAAAGVVPGITPEAKAVRELYETAGKEAAAAAKTTYGSWLEALEGRNHGTPDVAAGQPAAAPAAPEAGLAGAGGDVTGGAGGRDPRLAAAQAQAERVSGGHDPLPGLPTKAVDIGGDLYVPGPIGKVKDVAEGYMRDRLRPTYHTPPDKYYPLDPEHSKNIAQAYKEMNHEPDNPAVKASYDQMIRETRDQYRYIRANHPELQIEPITGPDPYGATPRMAAADVAHNNHLYFYPTEQGFGTSAQGGIDMATHPMMQPSGETLNGQPLLNNDLFRIVHDYFGHLKEGYGFRAAGEDNAWRSHASMYSDLARPAMTTETRGQNSWVNYGPHGDFNRTASAGDTRYADQKVGLMPEWTMRDRNSPEPIYTFQGSPSSHPQIDMSYIGSGEGTGVRGEGMYSADYEPIAEWYRHQLAARYDPLLKKYNLSQDQGSRIGVEIANSGGTHEPVVADLQDYVANLKAKQAEGDTSMTTKNQIKNSQNMIRYLNDPSRFKGHMYQLAIDRPDEHFIDWEKPWAQQSDYVRQKLQPLVEGMQQRATTARASLLQKAQERLAKAPPGVLQQKLNADIARYSQPFDIEGITGKNLYENAAHEMLGRAPRDRNEGYPISSQYLRNKGIAGVKYGSGTIHQQYQGHTNYATFDAPRILKRYAIPGMLGTGLAASMMSRGQQNGT